eukprot:6158790-Pyramimonas_sp.AAC.1
MSPEGAKGQGRDSGIDLPGRLGRVAGEARRLLEGWATPRRISSALWKAPAPSNNARMGPARRATAPEGLAQGHDVNA